MPKRKLSDFNDFRPSYSHSPHDRTDSIQTIRLKQKFEYGVITLSRALKTARGFERQKLGRREKAAKTEGNAETLKRIEEEIKVLKVLDPTKTAEKYLFKQLAKTKRIAEAPVFAKFKASKKISVDGPRSTAEANVTARLYKSNPVQNVFPGIMDGIRSLLGVEAPPPKEKSAKSDSAKTQDSRQSKKKEEPPTSKKGQSSEVDDSAEGQDFEMEDAEDSEGEDYSQFDARLASGSEEDSDVSDEDTPFADSKSQLRRSDMSISLSPSPEPSESPPPKKQKAKSSTQKLSAAPTTSTTFLPSLTMGGYWSGSESEAEDIDRVEEPPRRKNRMGQQARRALWEKKYGTGANHLKEQKGKGKNNRDSGWDARKGATGDRSRGRNKYASGANATDTGSNSKDRGFGGAPKKPQDDKPLHPSWEAARKAKEQKATASFQGKKVVFD